MKKIRYYIIGIFILMTLSCERQTNNNLKETQKNKKKISIIIKRDKVVSDTKNIEKLLERNENYGHLFNSFSKEEYSPEELADLVKQDLKFIKSIRQSAVTKRIDTATVSSRLLLAEVYLKKIDFLLQKKNIKKDTIEKTLRRIIDNFNDAIYQIHAYQFNFDEFESIISIDSLQKIKHDSLEKLSKKDIQHPKMKGFKFKLKKIF